MTILQPVQRCLILLCFAAVISSCHTNADKKKPLQDQPLPPGEHEWVTLYEGMELGRFKVSPSIPVADSLLYVLRVSPAHFRPTLFAASEIDTTASLDARMICETQAAFAATNAGMFHTDYKTHVGFMRSRSHSNNPAFNDKYHSFAVFDPKRPGLPAFDIVDRAQLPLDSLVARYHGVLQNLRLIKRPGENAWQQQPRYWSEAALAVDTDGNALIVICRSPLSMHDFNNLLLELPLGIVAAQHLEGGPEAQVCIALPEGGYWDWVGSFETGFTPHNSNKAIWSIPNVLAIVPVIESSGE